MKIWSFAVEFPPLLCSSSPSSLSLSNVVFFLSFHSWFRMKNPMPIYRQNSPPFTSSPASSFSKYTPLHHRLHHMSLLIIMTYYIIAYIICHYLHYNDILHHCLHHNDILYHYLHHNDVIFISRILDF